METFPQDWIKKIILVGLVLFIGFQVVTRVFFASFDYDEGYNLQIPLHVHANVFNYATYDAKFDPFISTGPTVLLPASVLISQNPMLPRLVVVCYSLFLIYLALKYFYSSFIQKLLFLLLLLVLPLFYFYSSHVLGELPGFVFVFSSFLLLKKQKYFLSGIFLALAILTKASNIVAVIPFAYMVLLFVKFLSLRKRLHVGLRMISAILFPFILWGIYGLLSLRFNIALWIEKLSQFEIIARELSIPRPYLFFLRFTMFGYVFYINGFLLILFVFLASLTLFITHRKDPLIRGLVVYVLVSLLQFLFLGNTIWYRQIFPAVLAFTMLLPIFLTKFIFPYKSRMILLICLLVLSSILYRRFEEPKDLLSVLSLEQKFTFYHEGLFPFMRPDGLLISQQNTAQFISGNIPGTEALSGIDWWNSPEISYLSGRRIYRNPFDKKNTFLLSGVYGKLLDPQEDEALSSINSGVVFTTQGYTIFKKK